MYKSTAIIRKVGDEFCVFSKDGKNLGCSKTREGAEKRLKQVEFFKNKGSLEMNYEKAFENFADVVNLKGLTQSPASLGDKTSRVAGGSIAGYASDRLLDQKEHFPVITHTQATSSLSRVMQLRESPSWYNGTVVELRQEVYAGIKKMHPEIELNVRVPAEQVVALSDGETPATTSKTSVKDPEDDRKKDMVPQVKRPTLTSAEVETALGHDSVRKVVAGRLMEMLDKQLEHMQNAKKLGERLLKGGLKSEEFDQLNTYVQEDILHSLMHLGVTASDAKSSEDRRQELLDRMSKQND